MNKVKNISQTKKEKGKFRKEIGKQLLKTKEVFGSLSIRVKVVEPSNISSK
jgi:hypothetical protein